LLEEAESPRQMAHLHSWTVSVLAALLALCLESNVVVGKCSGQWAIHACSGGNGKRSQRADSANIRPVALPLGFNVQSQDDLPSLDTAASPDYGQHSAGRSPGLSGERLTDLEARLLALRAQGREQNDTELKRRLLWRLLSKRFRDREEETRR